MFYSHSLLTIFFSLSIYLSVSWFTALSVFVLPKFDSIFIFAWQKVEKNICYAYIINHSRIPIIILKHIFSPYKRTFCVLTERWSCEAFLKFNNKFSLICNSNEIIKTGIESAWIVQKEIQKKSVACSVNIFDIHCKCSSSSNEKSAWNYKYSVESMEIDSAESYNFVKWILHHNSKTLIFLLLLSRKWIFPLACGYLKFTFG